MKSFTHYVGGLALTAGLLTPALGQEGPFDTAQWPPTVDPNALVNFVVTDAGLDAPSGNWLSGALMILSGGDQVTEDVTIGGHTGKKATAGHLNVADNEFAMWGTEPVIDILVQAYGNDALLSPAGEPRNFVFLIGTLPGGTGGNLNAVSGGQLPVEAKNGKWNWVLFRIPNDISPFDGTRYVSAVPPGAEGATGFGGVNGGTIRFEGANDLIVRAIAFGPQGAFGEPEQINVFFAPDECDPEPLTNLASINIDTDEADHIAVLDTGDQTVTYQDNVGPAGDQRRAVAPTGQFLNFGIIDEYLGKTCNDPRTIKLCLDFYDDPAFAGLDVRFGPEAYATDGQGGIGFVPAAQRHVMQGSGTWIRRSWTVAAVNLHGVNAGPYTAGPRFLSENGQVYVSSYAIAVFRTGDHPLAGIDPLPDCYEDPNICTDLYGNYAELDLHAGITEGLDVGTSGGDQEMIVAEAGPANDRRMAVRPARGDASSGTHPYLNFAILEEALGPSSQPPAHLAICVTYYDDPALTGASFRPEAYRTMRGGVETFGFVPESAAVVLAGTDEWRTAYWEIPDVKFSGVNQGPQAAARFFVTDRVFLSRVRYAVIRPCGPLAGVNLLEECKPEEDQPITVSWDGTQMTLAWPIASTGSVLQQTDTLGQPEWSPVLDTPTEVDGNYVLEIAPAHEARFYRLTR
jgi:hypothetical protein